MCGIAGLYGPRLGETDLLERIRASTTLLRHRGPDDMGESVWSGQSLALGHTRLSIQDLSVGGRQPMATPSGRFTIVFNGEIYNFHELSRKLRAEGLEFRSESDTEVMLAAIEVWGLDKALEQFVGMWAFALWDSHEQELTLCRDRIGEKPLYFGWHDGCFSFASELRAIEALCGSSGLQVSSSSVFELLSFGYIADPLSIYSGIHKLPAGTYVKLSRRALSAPDEFCIDPHSGPCSPVRYWSLQDRAARGFESELRTEAEALPELEGLLRSAISQQLISDVPVGAFLSGGIDSSLVCAIAQAESSHSIRTYTVAFDERQFDESRHAASIAEHLGTQHTTIPATGKTVVGLVPDVAGLVDEPHANSSVLPSYLVSKLAREHVTVCLSGDGGDELFGGYNRYVWSRKIWSAVGWLPPSLRQAVGRALLLSPALLARAFNSRKLVAMLPSAFSASNSVLKTQKLARFLGSGTLPEAYMTLLTSGDVGSVMKSAFRGPGSIAGSVLRNGSEFVESALLFDQMRYLPGDNLAKVDRSSMAASLETRLPFLDHRIVEMSWRLSPDLKIRDDQTKYLLRRLLYKFVPPELIERPKMGFSVPMAQWLRKELRPWGESLVNDATLVESVALDEGGLRKLWEEHQSGRVDASQLLWACLVLLAWRSARLS